MPKEEAVELLKAIDKLKDLKTKLMKWTNKDGYFLDAQMEAYLTGIVEASNA